MQTYSAANDKLTWVSLARLAGTFIKRIEHCQDFPGDQDEVSCDTMMDPEDIIQ